METSLEPIIVAMFYDDVIVVEYVMVIVTLSSNARQAVLSPVHPIAKYIFETGTPSFYV